MALLFAEGFDALGGNFEDYYFDYASALYMSFVDGRRVGSKALKLSMAGHAMTKNFPAAGTVIIGAAISQNNGSFYGDGGDNSRIFQLMRGGSPVLTVLRKTSDGVVSVRKGASNGTEIATTGTTTLPNTAYAYIQIKHVVGATGSVEILMDGVSILSASSVDTDGVGDGLVDGIKFCGAGGNWLFDDCYVCDSSGSVNNDYLGDVLVNAYMPDSDGSHTDFTRSSGTTNYELVDETNPSSTDYLDGTTVGHKESIGVTVDDNGQSIFGIMVNTFVYNPDAGLRKGRSFVKSGATTGNGTEVTLTPTMLRTFQVLETDPNDSAAWTPTKLNAAEFGFEVTV